ncbi:39S ribosomal protein L16, mitochondrial [Diprion similis]|uniref:39S ribosomal protein L16, mitochondrial n=1 Tax=Diprion similis TaxID=362088 RepID=UPI001EF7AF19|nr:39S ribosomal protein L16, mitochondrial [Diprion similis]
MLLTKCISRALLAVKDIPMTAPIAVGLKNFPLPKQYGEIEFPERRKLKIMDKVPTHPPNLRPPKMQKRLRYMRGPETLHNTLLHKQYGMVATIGGRLRWEHFEVIRLMVGRLIDTDRMFAIWRVDPPWQPVTKKGQGQRMGGGKGAIDHYVTPIKAGRVIFEIGGKCEFDEVKPIIEKVVRKMPFAAQVVSQELIDKKQLREEKGKQLNMNEWSFEYIIKNNMGGCHQWISPVDRRWFGKHR